MKTLLKTTLLASSVICALTACAPAKEKKETQVVNVSGQMDASQLTEAGEQLISPYTFMLADGVFAEALKKNPEDKKAQFYRSLLSAQMPLKGILTRIKPLVRQHGDIAKLQKTISDLPVSPLKNFLLDGQEDISTTEQAQAVISNVRDGYMNFRNFLKKNPTLELTLNLNPYTFEKEIKENVNRSCVVKDWNNQTENPDLTVSDYSLECSFVEAATVKINSADIVPLSQMASGMYLMFAIYNAYSYEGLENVSNNNDLSDEAAADLIWNSPKALTLRNDHGLKQIAVLGADLVPAAKWMLHYQDQLCPLGKKGADRRPGYLFTHGICISNKAEFNKDLAMLEKIIAGTISVEMENVVTGNLEKVNVNPLAISRKPVQDLRTLVSKQANECGNRTIVDKTLGGIFVDGNADKYSSSACDKN